MDATKASKLDIAENPKNIQFVEVEGAQLARTLESTDELLFQEITHMQQILIIQRL